MQIDCQWQDHSFRYLRSEPTVPLKFDVEVHCRTLACIAIMDLFALVAQKTHHYIKIEALLHSKSQIRMMMNCYETYIVVEA
jgi:hypothetical protein